MLTREKLIERLKAEQFARALSVKAFAGMIGVSERWLYAVYAMKKKPGTKILDFMGMEERSRVIESYARRE